MVRYIERLAHIIVLVIGMYMLITFSGGGLMTPPVLSGIAFTLLGAGALLK